MARTSHMPAPFGRSQETPGLSTSNCTVCDAPGAALPQVGPADQVDDANGGHKDDADVEEEPGGRVAVLVAHLARHSQEKENQAGDSEKNGPERYAGNVRGQGRHAAILTNRKDNRAICSRSLSPL